MSNAKFSGRCKHGKLPSECEKCNPPLTKEQVEKNILKFLKSMDKLENK